MAVTIELVSAKHKAAEIKLLLTGSDAEGWIAEAVIGGPKGPNITLDPTEVFATKELAGQSAFDAACEFINNAQNQARKRA